MENLDNILERACQIADDENRGPDEAARFLAPYRKQTCDTLHDNPAKIIDALSIATAQVHFLNRAGTPDKALGIAQWFLHLLHQTEEDIGPADFRRIKLTFRETFSRFFCRYARTLRDMHRIEDMRIAMRTAIDLTRELPGAIVIAIHLYLPLLQCRHLEDEYANTWFLKRCAEFLAALDFNGLGQTDFRACLDEFQFFMRDPQNHFTALSKIQTIAEHNLEDPAIQTLLSLCKTL